MLRWSEDQGVVECAKRIDSSRLKVRDREESGFFRTGNARRANLTVIMLPRTVHQVLVLVSALRNVHTGFKPAITSIRNECRA